MPKLADLVIVLAVVGCDQGVRKPPAAAADPARIAGTWDYRTESNCGSAGTGSVSFRWNSDRQLYREDGEVTWPGRDLTIRWWGDGDFDAKAHTLVATIDNSLGDKVTGTWRLEGDGPDRLVLDWQQTNGCHGVGTATRGLAKHK